MCRQRCIGSGQAGRRLQALGHEWGSAYTSGTETPAGHLVGKLESQCRMMAGQHGSTFASVSSWVAAPFWQRLDAGLTCNQLHAAAGAWVGKGLLFCSR